MADTILGFDEVKCSRAFLVLVAGAAFGCKTPAIMYYESGESYQVEELSSPLVSRYGDDDNTGLAFYLIQENVPCPDDMSEEDVCVNFGYLELHCDEEEYYESTKTSSVTEFVELAAYEDQNSCIDDMSGVLDEYLATGTIEAGPNGDSSGSGSGSSGGSDGGDFVCDSSFGDAQLDTMCCTAGSYQAAGHSEGHLGTCASLDAMIDCCYTGTTTCSYC